MARTTSVMRAQARQQIEALTRRLYDPASALSADERWDLQMQVARLRSQMGATLDTFIEASGPEEDDAEIRGDD